MNRIRMDNHFTHTTKIDINLAAKLGFAVTLPLDYIGIKDKDRFYRTKVKLIKSNVEIVEMQENVCLE